MTKYLPLDKCKNLALMIKQCGGIRATLYKLWRMDDVKPGKLMGCDKYGNKYYENKSYFYGRNRWIEYAAHYHLNYDGSQVPADWYGWLHYKTDLTPDKDPCRPHHKWMADHVENLTGTAGAYTPYATTRPKIHVWRSGCSTCNHDKNSPPKKK